MSEFEEIKRTMIVRTPKYWENYAKRHTNDKKAILKCVSNNGDLLYYASDELRSDKEVVLVAVSNCIDAFFYACPRLQHDVDVARAALHSTSFANSYFLLKIFDNKDFVVESVRYYISQNPMNAEYVLGACPEYLRCDREVIDCIPLEIRGSAMRRCFRLQPEGDFLQNYLRACANLDEIDRNCWKNKLFCLTLEQTAYDRMCSEHSFSPEKMSAFHDFVAKKYNLANQNERQMEIY